MEKLSHVTVQLARFDEITSLSDVDTACAIDGPAIWLVGADEGAAGAEFASQRAQSWIAVGLHESEASAVDFFQAGDSSTPFFDDASERWMGLLQPFNHRGETNWLSPDDPGPAFSTGPPPDSGAAFVVMTSVGWVLDERFDVDKALDFGAGVAKVRESMVDVDGLHSQQNFNFPGLLTTDGITLTFWRDDSAMRAFAYRPGEHKTQLDRYHDTENADRTSFTRLRVLEHSGFWNGTDPFAW